MRFGFRRGEQESIPYLHRAVMIFFGFLALWLVGKIASMPFSDSDTFLENIDEVLVATSGISKERSSVAYTISQAIKTKGSSLTEWNISAALDHIATADLSFVRRWFDHPEVLAAVQQWATFKDDILWLLWFNRPQNYLIILQNTGERRPNGWFFGSFALLTLDKGRVKTFEIKDSYLPGYDKPWTTITGPEWMQEFLPDRTIHFIGANKIGFTYHDGAHIKTLYEKSYPGQSVRGVVFVTTDLFELLLPDFRQQLREWQFVNASVDLIRGEARRGKKVYYINDSQNYFTNNLITIIYNWLKNIDTLRKGHYINIYLENISWPLHGFIRRQQLTTRFESNMIYFWESNISFNKIDRFVARTIACNDQDWKVIVVATHERLTTDLLPSGKSTCVLTYRLSIPDDYITHIAKLEKQYDITLTEREQHILALDPERHTRAIVYYPKNIAITWISGDGYDSHVFDTPFSRALTYKVWLGDNWASKEVVIEIEK